MELLLAVPFGLAIGAVVGAVGGGGAILALPVLVYVLGEGVSPASTASLIVVAVGAAVGTAVHARHGKVCVAVAAAFTLPAIGGAYFGTLLNGEVGPQTLVIAFVPVMLGAALLTYVRGSDLSADEADGSCPTPHAVTTGGSGLAVGALTGFFGVGGGFLIVPALTLLGIPMKRAIATSLAIIAATGAAALAFHLAEGAEPDWALTMVLGLSVALGAIGGSHLGHRMDPSILARAFAIVVGCVATFLLFDVLLLGGPPTGT